jgi:uncharacterized protein (DUF2235 family)
MPKPKPKNIIVLSDGTGNSAAKFNKTNVWRTYEALDLSNSAKQIAYFDDGVGNSSFKPLALLGGALGIGLSRNVRELYAFLCRNYEDGDSDSERGDRIYGFGFSRGAFTIRILAGLVCKYGLLRRSAFKDDRELRKKTKLLFRAYRKQASGDGITPLLALAVRALRDSVPGQSFPANFHTAENFHLEVPIEFLGLWDTVDAYGLPIDELTKGWDRWVWPLSMRNRDLSSKVKKAAHALSLDDERNSFHPLLWNESGSSPGTATIKPMRLHANAKYIADEPLSQVWFAGMHADVGGGYPDDFLSYVPLNWVLTQSGQYLKFNQKKRDEYVKAARISGAIHDSRQGFASYYRFLPRKLEKLINSHHTIIKLGWGTVPTRSVDNVVQIERPKIHHSVFERIRAHGLSYAPIVIPEKYAVVTPQDQIVNPGRNTFESAAKAKLRAVAQEKVWDIVWFRRIAYFSTLGVTACLVLLPWIRSIPVLREVWPLSFTKDGEKCVDSVLCFASAIPKLVGVFLPAFASRWVETFSANPGVFSILAVTLGVLMLLGKWLDGKKQAHMTAVWHQAAASNTAFSCLYRFRESAAYQWTLRRIKKHVLPFFFGMAVLATIAFVGISGASRTVFSVADSYGTFCSVEAKAQASAITSEYARTPLFDPSSVCWATGLAAEEGATYRVVMNIAETMGGWKDDTLEADLQGNLEDHNPIIAILALPAKRYLRENYYKPVARIRTRAENRSAGQDEYVLNPTFLSSKKRYDCLVSDFTAQSSGELFLFVNDAIIYFRPDSLLETYANNNGKAEVFVKRIAKTGEPFVLPEKMTTTSACKEFAFTPPK